LKKILIVLCVLFCFVGTACGKDNKIKLNKEVVATEEDSSSYLYNRYGLLSYEFENTEEYDSKINDKDSFLMFVYRENCYGCGLLAPALENYVDENSVAIYTIEITKITNHSLYTVEQIKDTPYLVIVKEGKIAKKEVVTLTNNVEDNKSWVNNWMDKNIIWEE